MNYRERCLEEKGRECKECGSVEDIEVHHKDGDRTNNDIDNLIPLCKSCHDKKHRGRSKKSNGDGMTSVTVRLRESTLQEIEKSANERDITRSREVRDRLRKSIEHDNKDIELKQKEVEMLRERCEMLKSLI